MSRISNREIHVLICLALLLLLGSCNSRKGNILISGSYPEGKGDYIQLQKLNVSQAEFIDSVKVKKNGDFRFLLNLDAPEIVFLRNTRGQNINILAFPEDHIQVRIPGSTFTTEYEIKGSPESEKIRILVQNLEETKIKLDSIAGILELEEDLDNPESRVLISSYQQILQNQKRQNIRFVIENLNSLASVYALYQRITPEIYLFNEVRDIQYFKIVADSVSIKYPGSSLSASLVNDVARRINEYNNTVKLNELARLNAIETGLVELSIENSSGSIVSLRSLKGKVVLLNFWASWDRASRDASRTLRPIYEKYNRQGFEIYSVALEKEKDEWINALNFEEYPWINVSELSFPYSYAANVYNVTQLPANYLIDREGNIVAKNLFGSALSTWLDNLL